MTWKNRVNAIWFIKCYLDIKTLFFNSLRLVFLLGILLIFRKQERMFAVGLGGG